MKNKFSFGFLAAGLLLGLNACETDDVNPTPLVSISTNQINISEDNGITTVIATLTNTATTNVVVDLFAAGSATNTVDYILSASSITIPSGSLSGSISLTAIQDTLKEGIETIDLTILSLIGAEVGATSAVSITIEDDDVEPTARLIINEILYDPSNSGLDGDANGDGSYSQAEDEFVEFINLSSLPIDLSGYKIYDTEAFATLTPRHVIPANTIIPAGGVFVVFGGGTPTGTFGGAVVQTSTTGNMNMNNAGDELILTDTANAIVISIDVTPFSDNPNESYTRNPDITGEFEQHSANTTLLFSPGTKIDGSSF
jgi:hypothetical protein